MNRYVFQKTITYYLEVEANTAEEAEELAQDIDILSDDVYSGDADYWELIEENVQGVRVFDWQ